MQKEGAQSEDKRLEDTVGPQEAAWLWKMDKELWAMCNEQWIISY